MLPPIDFEALAGSTIIRNRGGLHNIYSVQELRALLEHERRRSDRTGDRFSVLVIDLDVLVRKKDVAGMDHIVRFLRKRLRGTDEIGWFDHRKMAVLLLDTPSEGAWKVASDLKELLQSSISEDAFQVFAYPSDYFDEDKGSEPVPSKKPFPNPENVEGGLPSTVAGISNIFEKTHSLEPHLGKEIPAWKRTFDLFFSVFGLVLFIPFGAFVGLIIRIVSPGPVFFRQIRIGYLGRRFTLLKFRTMKPGVDRSAHENYVKGLINNDTPMKKLHIENQIIPFGNFLRRTGMDELPQLVNVLRGEMSLVGPRPCLPGEFQEYLHWNKRRFYTLPGITGLWQVMGKHNLTFKEMIRYDITYEQHKSLWMDIRIMAKTVSAVLMMSTDG